MNRAPWPTYFLSLAEQVATRGTCPRLAVGAVLVSADGALLSAGYNGAVRGAPHCAAAGCILHHGHCLRAVHAEANAVAQAAARGIPLRGAAAYVTHEPCVSCYHLLVAAGVAEVHYRHPYGNQFPGMADLERAAAVPRFHRPAPVPPPVP